MSSRMTPEERRAARQARREAFWKDLSDLRHGTANGYSNLGCRCSRCTTAHSDYCKLLLQKKAIVEPPCSTEGCDNPPYSGGLCVNCYRRTAHHGSADYVKPKVERKVGALGMIIIDACTKHNWKQNDVADKIGYSPGWLSHVVHGRGLRDIVTLDLLAKTLKVEREEVINAALFDLRNAGDKRWGRS